MTLQYPDYRNAGLEMPPIDEDFNFSIPFDMDSELYDDISGLHTIQSDLEKMGNVDGDFSYLYMDNDEDMKPEIRNVDCMWSSMTNCLNPNVAGTSTGTGSNSAASSYSETSAISLAVACSSTNAYSAYQRLQSQTTDNNSSNSQSQQQQANNAEDSPVVIKKELEDPDYTFSQKRRRLSAGDKKSQMQIQDEDQLIPPGGSLLRKRNLLVTSSPSPMAIRKGCVGGEVKSSKYLRPDTPHSLTDEVAAPEFRHNVDLRACVMGSNNISLTSDDGDVNCINQISRDLQNAGKDLCTVRFPFATMNDVLDVLSHQVNAGSNPQQTSQEQMDEQQQAIDIATGCSTVASPPTTGSDSDSDDGDSLNYGLRHHRSSKGTTGSSSSNNVTNTGMSHMLHISDHSYTRCNDMVDDGPNLETPSDSDEEIDVVSYTTDKKLPTNPSCHVMGALQTKMAHKIAIDHMTQKPRYNNFNLPYTPASSSPVKSVANSRYPSPSSTPYQHCSSASPSYSPLSVDSSNVSSSSSSSSSQSSFTSNSKGRKRTCLKAPGGGITSSMILPGISNGNNGNAMMSKKCRGKKVVASSASSSGSTSPVSALSGQDVDPMDRNWQRRSTVVQGISTSCSSSVLRKDFSLGLDEADTIEKRNQHNDMERQRRIGLKNLFEALKKQIPTIRDKERAPKVNILREAAKLCIQLTQEEQELSLQRQLLSVKLKQQQEILARYRKVKSEPHSISG
ncbi:myc protein [Drosophila elegans]|uniref:myc protein n=1 Tax=Drosophila elegans TaxID=30023 RepID=UPI0007E89EEE|nr:myc protein [Drosophila elegans]